ncbi:MAG: hypothetical protein C4543_06070 [Ignavibacteriales bacterium]|jgi:hypothetical protein|nr:hypothetical protein [Melioribacteraceae bacterium]RJP59709.1 MAG: hypothetical protein C4543_06070 [Ignavibacteriales bacterium]
MRNLISILITFVFISCNVNDTNDSERIITSPVPAQKIDKIIINGNALIAEVVYTTSTPCWVYDRVEKSQNDTIFTAKVFARSDGSQICPQVIDSILVKHSIIFQSGGDKILRFWRYDSTYLDTTITIK